MNTDTEALAALNRIMPDAPPAISPQDQHQRAIKDQLATAQQELEELGAAVRLCDQDIQAPIAVAAEIATLEEQRTKALAASYLKRKVAGISISKLNSDIETLKRSLEPLKVTAAGAAAARCELIAQQASQSTLGERLQRDLALSGALGPAAYSRAAASYSQEQRRETAARQQQVARDAAQQERQRGDEERQRRQRVGQHGPIGADPDVPAWLQNMPG